MIQVLFFGQTRDLIGVDELSLSGKFLTVEDIRIELSKRPGKWALALDKETTLFAVNQTMVSSEHAVREGDEVAFFPPVTGG